MEMKACICLDSGEGQMNPEPHPMADAVACKVAAFTAGDFNSTSIK